MASERDDDLLDIISEALDESMDVDWTSRDGARHVLGALQIGGYLATPPPASADALGEVERVARVMVEAQGMEWHKLGGGDHGYWESLATAALSAMITDEVTAEQRGYDRAIAEVVVWLREQHDGRLVSRIYLANAIEAGEHKP